MKHGGVKMRGSLDRLPQSGVAFDARGQKKKKKSRQHSAGELTTFHPHAPFRYNRFCRILSIV